MTDYQLPINLNYSNFDFTEANFDGSDVRFIQYMPTNQSQRELDYWIEKWNSTQRKARVWVKIPYLEANQTTTIYIYYGNPSATSNSNFDRTMQKLSTDEWTAGLWHFDEGKGTTIHDIANQNDGRIYGATWSSFDGGQWNGRQDVKFESGDSLNFDGIDDYVEVPDSTTLNTDSQITIEAWIYPKAISSEHGIVAKYWRQYYLRVGLDKKPEGGVFIENDKDYRIYGTTTLSTQKWHHIVFTYNGQYMRIYVNGNEENSIPLTGRIASTTQPLTIGQLGNEEQFFNGIIDEVRILNKALNIDEIRASYERRKYAFPKPKVDIESLPPINLKLLQPKDDTINDIAEILINVTSRANDITNMTLKILKGSKSVYTTNMSKVLNTEWKATWDTTKFPEETYTITVDATTAWGDALTFNITEVQIKQTIWFKIQTFIQEPTTITFIVVMAIYTFWTLTLKEEARNKEEKE